MKRLLTFLLFLILSVPAFADGFGANDKVLYFNSDVLIDVIKRNFANDLQLNVAQKYVDLMDVNGNVSIVDLVTVCKTGNLDTNKCRVFINDLLKTAETDIKPFYWADYVSVNTDPIGLNSVQFGDGTYNYAKSGLLPGEWAIQFGWMKYKHQSFRKQYPNNKFIGGTSACTSDVGTRYVADSSKNYSSNQQTGNQCWCRMTVPEQSAWVYNGDIQNGGTCHHACALSCMTNVRDKTQMRGAIFTTVKLNESNANSVADNTTKDILIKKFTPCEFDWVKDIDVYARPHPKIKFSGSEWTITGYKWMNGEKFQCKYPDVNEIKGTSSIKNYGYGKVCLCKMTEPEESAWVEAEWNVYVGGSRECGTVCAHSIAFGTIAGDLCSKDDYSGSKRNAEDMFKSIGKK